MVFTFVLWVGVLKMAIMQVSFSTCRKRLEVVGSLVPLRYTMIKQRLYNQYLARDTDESGGHEALDGGITVHQILTLIRWIILYISININPEQ